MDLSGEAQDVENTLDQVCEHAKKNCGKERTKTKTKKPTHFQNIRCGMNHQSNNSWSKFMTSQSNETLGITHKTRKLYFNLPVYNDFGSACLVCMRADILLQLQ